MKRILLCVAMFSVVFVHAAFAADSTSFDPLPVSIKAMGGGVPVGTVISWPVATNPENYENWLECDGQTISPAVYPELFAVVGAKVPDLRGLFLRGHGSRTSTHYGTVTHGSGSLGQLQGDAIRNATGMTDWFRDADGLHAGSDGVFAQQKGITGIGGSRDTQAGNIRTSFDLSRVVPVANENRPVNMAVRYLIRARP